jgi:hypothetical protein
LIGSPADIESAIKAGRNMAELIGIVVILGEKIGMWGDLEVVELENKI